MRGGRSLWTCVVMLAACQDLPELQHGVCGNGVVESGEDCDGRADPEHACSGADEPNPCRYTCAAATCPTGWGCSDGVCRYGTGELVADSPVPLAHSSLAIADLDGDRRGDIIAIGTRGVHVLFEDRTTFVATSEESVGSTVVEDLDGDDQADLVAPTGQGLVVSRGEVDRTMTPVSYAQFVTQVGSWFVPARLPLANEADAVVGFTATSNAPAGISVTSYLVPSGMPQETTQLTATVPVTSLGPRALRTNFDAASGGDEVIVTAAGHPTLWMVRPSVVGNNLVVLQPEARGLTSASDGQLLLADVDGDSDHDVLVGVHTSSGAGVIRVLNESGAFGNPSPTLYFDRLASPAAHAGVPSAPQRFPLAVAHLDSDGSLDAVSPDAVFLSGTSGLVPVHARTTTKPWRDAVIVDVDGDQRLDVIVSSSDAGIDVLRNGPAGFTRVAIDTAGPATSLRAGDFDGDGLGDVAFLDRGGRDRVRVLFGAIGAFAPPVTAIGLPDIHRLEVGRFRDPRGIDDPADDLVLSGWDGSRPGVSFVTGAGDRRMRAPLLLAYGPMTDTPLGVAAGRFFSDDRGLAVLAADRTGDRRLWLFKASATLAYRTDEATVMPSLGALESLERPRLITADVDGDGRDEVIALGQLAGVTRVVIVQLQGVPSVTTFEAAVGEPRDLVGGDVDHDGRSELFIAGTTGFVRWEAGELATIAETASTVCLAQLDADAQLEIVFVMHDTLNVLDGRSLSVQHTQTTSSTIVRAGDLDGDAVDDLLLGDEFSITRMHSVPQVKL